MQQRHAQPKNPPNHGTLSLCLLVLFTALFLVHCGGGDGSQGTPTGSVAFSVAWDRGDLPSDDVAPLALTDCGDVTWVEAAVFDSAGTLLGSGGPWDCEDREGLLQGIPADRDVWVAVAGLWEEGLVRYRGESDLFHLPPGATVQTGVIEAGSFVPIQTAPDDGETVAVNHLALQWTAVFGAHSYTVTLVEGPDGPGEVRTFRTDAPTLHLDPSTLAEDIGYLWSVQAQDAAGSLSEPSGYRQFQVLRNLLDVFIEQPPWDEFQEYFGIPIAFSATVWGADETMYTQDQLAVVRWSSDIDGPFGDQLDFEYGGLSLGGHVITLQVEALNGLAGSAQRWISINP